jgi:hypothetical protein
MATREHEAKHIITNVVVDRDVQRIDRRLLLRFELPVELFVFAVDSRISTPEIDRAPLGRRREPRTGIPWNPGCRPLLERRDESVLSQIFGNPHVVHEPSQAGDECCRFNPPYGFDGAVYLRRRGRGASQ